MPGLNRKYPHRLLPKAVIPSGWFMTDATMLSPCPKCRSAAGFDCVTPSGKRARGMSWCHKERLAEYLKHWSKET